MHLRATPALTAARQRPEWQAFMRACNRERGIIFDLIDEAFVGITATALTRDPPAIVAVGEAETPEEALAATGITCSVPVPVAASDDNGFEDFL